MILIVIKRVWPYLPTISTWTLVFAFPLVVWAICARSLHFPAFSCLAVGAIALVVSMFSAEIIFRFAKIAFGLDESYKAPQPGTVGGQLAEIISNVLTQSDTRVTQLESLIPVVVEGTAEMRALHLLNSCIRANRKTFDPALIQANWQALASLMNELRE